MKLYLESICRISVVITLSSMTIITKYVDVSLNAFLKYTKLNYLLWGNFEEQC
jgi:hypothetical protein